MARTYFGACSERTLRHSRRAAVAPMMAVMAMPLLGMTALIVDTGFWIIGSTRLQIAADAAAMGGAFLLNTSLKSANASTQTSTLQSVGLYEAQAASTKLMGVLTTPITVTTGNNFGNVTVTLYSQAPAYLGNVFKVSAPLLRATATAGYQLPSFSCLLTLGTTGTDIKVDNSGTLSASNCPIFSNSRDPNASIPSIYTDSGTITAPSIGAYGSITQSNSGSNSVGPNPVSPFASSPTADPNTSLTVPTATSPAETQAIANCGANANNSRNFTAYGTYSFPSSNSSSYVFCGNTTLGGNGSTDAFAPGTYYVVNGDLTFNNATISSFTGVQFIMTSNNNGTVGNFSYTNYSNTSIPFTAPTTGSAPNIAIWQGCNSSGSQTMSFQGGSTLNITGSVYAPCSSVDVGNNAQLSAPLTKSFGFVSKSIYVHGSAAVRTGFGGASGTASSTPVLTN